MTYAPTTNAPARNANVEAYINPDPNPNPNPNPYPALNQKPNHTLESNSVFGEVSMRSNCRRSICCVTGIVYYLIVFYEPNIPPGSNNPQSN